MAQEYTETAILVLAEFMESKDAPPAARISAASGLLDRGHGRLGQYIEAQVSPLEELSDTDLLAGIAALKQLTGSAVDDAPRQLTGSVASGA